MNQKQLLLAVPMLILAAAIVVFLRSPHEQDASVRDSNKSDAGPALPKASRQMQELRFDKPIAVSGTAATDMQKLVDGMNELRRELEALKQKDTTQSSAQASDASLSIEEQRQQEWERTSQATAFLEANLTGQSKDPSWSLNAERQVSAALAAEEIAAGSELQGLSCQATLCRIQSKHSDSNAERAFMTRLGRLEAFGDGEAFSQRSEQSNGSVEIVTFVTRSGYRLPEMPMAD